MSRLLMLAAVVAAVGVLPWLSGRDPALSILRARSAEQVPTEQALTAVREQLGLAETPWGQLQSWLAEVGNPGHVAAPFAGVVTLAVAEGDLVETGQTVATIEAMKMEASITAAKGGTVTRVAIAATQPAEGGDLLVVIS